MTRVQEQLKKKSESIRLRANERSELRERLVAYMEYHPLPKDIREQRVDPTTIISEVYTTIKIDALSFGRYLGAFAVLFLIIVPVVAERAVPGDVLYPVKVSFNEELRSTLALSPYQKVEWETARLERRIAEARLLANEGKLTPEVEAEVAEAVKAHSDGAQKEIATLRETDGEEAAIAGIALTSALDVQSEFLAGKRDEVASTTAGHSVMALASAVDQARESAAEASLEEEISHERLLAQIETETTRAYEYINAIEAVATEDERTDIERRLSDINTKIKDATENTEEDSAIVLLTTALSDTRKLISFMSNIDVREHVTIEALVPVTLTDEEKAEIVAENLVTVDELVAVVESRREFLPADIAEKTNFGLTEIMRLLASSTEAIDAEALNSAINNSGAALELAEDLSVLTEPYREAREEEVDDKAEETASSTDNGTDGVEVEAEEDTVEEVDDTDAEETATSSPNAGEAAVDESEITPEETEDSPVSN